ncbi:ATP-binding protein [Vibrio owensii]|uniref:ATP-binding protein n=1 Tax=Vibrio owensii TaxID=696485 RepID=UPI003395F029
MEHENENRNTYKFGVLKTPNLPFFNGNITVPLGYQHDVTLLISELFNSNIEYVSYDSLESIEKGLLDKEIDFAIGYYTNEFSKNNLLYSKPIFKEPILAWSSNFKLRSSDFDRVKWGCIRNSVSCKVLENLNYNYTTVKDTEELFNLVGDQYDAILGAYSYIIDYLKRHENLKGRTFYYKNFGYRIPAITVHRDNEFYLDDIDNSLKKEIVKDILQTYNLPSFDDMDFFAEANRVKVIRYTVSSDLFPLSYFDHVSGEYKGFIHDLMNLISVKTPLEFTYIPPEGNSEEQMLLDGKVDVLPSMNIKLIQDEYFLGTNTYTTLNYLQVEKASDYKFKSFAILDRIDILPPDIIDSNFKIYKDLNTLLDALDSGEVTNAYLNEYIISGLINLNEEKFRILHNAEQFQVELAMATDIKNQKLANLLNSALDIISEKEKRNIWKNYEKIALSLDKESVFFERLLIFFLILLVTIFVLFYKRFLVVRKNLHKTREQGKKIFVKNKWLKQILDSIPSMVCIFDHNGKLVMSSIQFQEIVRELGYKRQDELLNEIVIKQGLNFWDEFDQNIEIEIPGSKLYGKSFNILNKKMYNIGVNKDYFLLIINDNSYFRIRENSLIIKKNKAMESIEAQKKFIAVISHELRTPISAMLGLMEILNTKLDNNEDKNLLSNTINSANRLNALLNDILDYSKLDVKQVKIVNQECDLSYELCNSLRAFEAEARNKKVGFHLNWIISPYLLVKTDAMRLNQIISNLLSNAIKFTEKGFVSVKIDPSPNALLLSIRDTGIGMTKQQLELMFEPFTQASDSITRHYGGSGLGLSIVKSLVELMGGSITINSELGLGTVVDVNLPVESKKIQLPELRTPIVLDSSIACKWAKELNINYIYSEKGNQSEDIIYPDLIIKMFLGDTFQKVSEGEMVDSYQSLTGSVLVVEDDPINTFLIEKQLSGFGLEVILANNSGEAISYLHDPNVHVDIMITDCHMAGMSGIELAEYIRKQNISFPILACTADNSKDLSLKAISSGVNKVLYKPYTLSQLHNILSDYLPNSKENNVIENPYWYEKFDIKQRQEMAGIIVSTFTNLIAEMSDENSNFESIAHRVKGSSGALGLQELFDVSVRLENESYDQSLRLELVNKLKTIIAEAKKIRDTEFDYENNDN